MELTSTYIVLRDKKDGSFLVEFESKKTTFAYSSSFSDRLEDAATMNIEAYENQKNKVKFLAKALGCEIVKVVAHYKLTYPNGSEAKEIKSKDNDNPLFGLFNAFQKEKGGN